MFTADRFSDFSDGCYSSGSSHIRPIQWYLREFWYPVTQMWEAGIPVLPRLLPHLQWWLQSSNLLTGVPLNPRIHTDYLHRRLPNRMGAFLEGRTVSGVCEDCHLEEHINLLKMRAVLLSLRHFQEVIQRQSLLIATDNTTVVAYLQNQGGTHSFSLYLICREIMLLCQTVLTVRHVPSNHNLIADALSRFRVPVNTEWELHSVIFQAITLIWDRPLIDLFATSLNYKSRPESLGSGCNGHLLERDVQLHLPTISSSPQDFTQDKRGWL